MHNHVAESEIWGEGAFSFPGATECSGDMLYRFDVENMRFDYASESVADALGVSRSELTGMSLADILDRFHRDDLRRLRGLWKAVRGVEKEGKSALPAEYRIRCNGGNFSWFSDIWVVFGNDKGSAKYVIGCARNISIHKENERKLREANSWLQSIMDNIEEHVNIIDPDGSVLWHNMGRSGAGRVEQGKKCWEAFEGRTERCPHCVHPAILADGKPRDYEGHTGSDGANPRTWWVRAVPMRDEKNEIYAILETAIDITERKKQEQERIKFESNLHQVQKLESLGLMAGGIAHDFNNILASILGNASLLMSELDEDSPYWQSLGEIESAAKRASAICQQMLVYSGRGIHNIAPVNLNHVVQDISSLLKVSISKRITVAYELKESLPSIMADAAQMSQVIMNLLTNAAEAIGDREGLIKFTTGEMHCDRRWFKGARFSQDMLPGNYVFMEVSDTGCGMADDTLHCMFDPFFTTKFTGRGLGMAVVLGIIRNHGGAIKVESVPGDGTTFRIVFPAAGMAADDSNPKHADGKTAHGRNVSGTVLLIDDESSVRSICGRMLEKGGFKVLVAEDGGSGISLFRRHSAEIACVILDFTMPDMTGEKVFLALKEIKPDVRVLLSSGYSNLAHDRFLQMGVSGFLGKPYEYSSLIERVLSVMRV